MAATAHSRLVEYDAAMLHFGAANQCPNVSGQTILKLTGSAVHPRSLTIIVADVESVGFVDDCDVAVDTAVGGEVDVACFAGVVVAAAVNIVELIDPLAIENLFVENDRDPETYAVEPAAVCVSLIAEGINLGQESFLVVTLTSLN